MPATLLAALLLATLLLAALLAIAVRLALLSPLLTGLALAGARLPAGQLLHLPPKLLHVVQRLRHGLVSRRGLAIVALVEGLLHAFQLVA